MHSVLIVAFPSVASFLLKCEMFFFQVSDTLPTALFQKFDVPVDIIVTPTEVIRVAKRLPRPTGLFWELLSERRLKIVPVLQIIKENEEKLVF